MGFLKNGTLPLNELIPGGNVIFKKGRNIKQDKYFSNKHGFIKDFVMEHNFNEDIYVSGI